MVNGKKEGNEYWYYENGNIKLEVNFISGKKEGELKKYSETGEVIQKQLWKNDEVFDEEKQAFREGDFDENYRYYQF